MEETSLKCEYCDKIFSGAVCRDQHFASEKHKKKVQQHNLLGGSVGNRYSSQYQYNKESHVFTQGHSQCSSYPCEEKSEKDKGNFFCALCDLNLSNSDLYQQHLLSSVHSEKVLNEVKVQLKMLCESSNSNKDIEGPTHCRELYCEPCECNCNSKEQYEQHIRSSKHEKKLKQVMSLMPYKMCCSNAAHSGVLENNSLDQSCLSETVANPFQNMSSLVYTCDVCNISLSGVEPYNQHMEGKKHLKKLHAKQNARLFSKVMNSEGNMSVLLNTVTQSNSSYSDHSEETHHDVERKSSPLSCKPCNKIFSGRIPFLDHLRSLTHLKKVRNSELQSSDVNLNSNSTTPTDSSSEIDDECMSDSVCHDIKIYDPSELDLIVFSPEMEVTFNNLPSQGNQCCP